MTREEMIAVIGGIKDPVKEIDTIYGILDELGIEYKKTRCSRCRKDLWNIAREELGLIEDAAEVSTFNDTAEWRYKKANPVRWKGIVYDQNTDPKLIAIFVSRFPNGYYELVAVEQHIEEITEEENTYSND